MWNPNPDQSQSSNRQYLIVHRILSAFSAIIIIKATAATQAIKSHKTMWDTRNVLVAIFVDDPPNHSFQKEEIAILYAKYGNEFNNHEGKHKFQKRPWEDGGSQMSYGMEAPPVLLVLTVPRSNRFLLCSEKMHTSLAERIHTMGLGKKKK